MGVQGLDQDLKTGCPRWAIIIFWLLEDNIHFLDEYMQKYLGNIFPRVVNFPGKVSPSREGGGGGGYSPVGNFLEIIPPPHLYSAYTSKVTSLTVCTIYTSKVTGLTVCLCESEYILVVESRTLKCFMIFHYGQPVLESFLRSNLTRSHLVDVAGLTV